MPSKSNTLREEEEKTNVYEAGNSSRTIKITKTNEEREEKKTKPSVNQTFIQNPKRKETSMHIEHARAHTRYDERWRKNSNFNSKTMTHFPFL